MTGLMRPWKSSTICSMRLLMRRNQEHRGKDQHLHEQRDRRDDYEKRQYPAFHRVCLYYCALDFSR